MPELQLQVSATVAGKCAFVAAHMRLKPGPAFRISQSGKYVLAAVREAAHVDTGRYAFAARKTALCRLADTYLQPEKLRFVDWQIRVCSQKNCAL